MGSRIAGHQNCLICHPDLDPKYHKRGLAKGLRRYSVADRRRLQDNINNLAFEYDDTDSDEAIEE